MYLVYLVYLDIDCNVEEKKEDRLVGSKVGEGVADEVLIKMVK